MFLRLSILEKIVYREANIPSDLAKQDRGNVSAGVERNRRPSTIGMAKLFMRTPLSNFLKADAPKNSHDLLWFQNGN
jgi:hypothetical protein